MLRWVYTDELEFREDDAFLTELMKLANRFQLQLLRERQVAAVPRAPPASGWAGTKPNAAAEGRDCAVAGTGLSLPCLV